MFNQKSKEKLTDYNYLCDNNEIYISINGNTFYVVI